MSLLSTLVPSLESFALLVAKTTLLLALAGAAAFLLRDRSAAARHLLWGVSLGALLALPLLMLTLPTWHLPVPAIPGTIDPSGAASAIGAGELSGAALAGALWAAGALMVLCRFLAGLAGVRRIARQARPVDDPQWRALAHELAAELEIRVPVRLLRGDNAGMPMTWGMLRPTIFLPAAADAWPEGRRRAVLLHELAHVARRDCLMQGLASVSCAIHWFHPGAWWAARRMRIERETACDDRVLATGTRASEYAGHLLEVARAIRPRGAAPAAAVAMAAPSHLEGRVLAVLDAARARGAVTRRAASAGCAAALLILLPLAAAAPSERTSGPVAPPREIRDSRPRHHGAVEAVRPPSGPLPGTIASAAGPAAPRTDRLPRPQPETARPDRSADPSPRARQPAHAEAGRAPSRIRERDMEAPAPSLELAGAGRIPAQVAMHPAGASATRWARCARAGEACDDPAPSDGPRPAPGGGGAALSDIALRALAEINTIVDAGLMSGLSGAAY